MTTYSSPITRFFGVVTQGQTYLNALYLLLAFPLGLAYFVFLTTGISLGLGMIILWVGLLILAAIFAAWYGLAAFERWLAMTMLREDIPPMVRQDLSDKTLWQKFVITFKNPVTWKGLAYLVAKFPLGIITFTVVVTLAAVSISLIAMPFYYQYVHYDITIENSLFQPWLVDTLPEAVGVSIIGILIGLVSLHIFNGLAWISGKFARVMLGNFTDAQALPPTPVAPAVEIPPTPATGS